MGFSLQAFFADLLSILTDEAATDSDKLEALTKAINDGYEYARACGQVAAPQEKQG